MSLLPLAPLPALAPLAAATRRRPNVALIVPRTGPHAALGLSMERAALLAGKADAPAPIVVDGGTLPESAAAAAAEAVKRGATLILGPVFAPQVRPVVAVASGRATVLAFSNDAALRDSGAFLLGIAPSQLTSAVLQYARGRGVRSVAVIAGADQWAAQSAQAAQALQAALGLSVTVAADADGILAGTMPDAVLLAGSAFDMAGAESLRPSGVQLLAALPAPDRTPAGIAAARGAWIAAPDPDALADFSQRYTDRNGGAPGLIAALAYDAATIANATQGEGSVIASGTTFPGIAGAVRFRADGSCTREVAILLGRADDYPVIGHSISA